MKYRLPVPLDDELAAGFLGRFAQLNAVSRKQALEMLKAGASVKERYPPIWMLAAACGIDHDTFTSRYSMLPVMYPISGYFGGSRELKQKLSISYRGFSTATALRWCAKCAREDFGRLGFGYWRRRHQILGIDWCVEHRVGLFQKDDDTINDEVNVPISLQDAVTQICQESHHPVLRRFEEILLAWLHRQRPFRLRAWTNTIGNRCRELGLRVGEVGGRQVASDLIREQFPSSWLARHLPEISTKEPRTYIRKVDGACVDKHVAYPALACAAILAALFSTATEAIAALDEADGRIEAEQLAQPCSQIALQSFLAGKRLQKACDDAGVELIEVERLLRGMYLKL